MMMIDLISLLLILAILTAILGAVVMLPTENGERERARMIRKLAKLRKKRGYHPCGGR